MRRGAVSAADIGSAQRHVPVRRLQHADDGSESVHVPDRNARVHSDLQSVESGVREYVLPATDDLRPGTPRVHSDVRSQQSGMHADDVPGPGNVSDGFADVQSGSADVQSGNGDVPVDDLRATVHVRSRGTDVSMRRADLLADRTDVLAGAVDMRPDGRHLQSELPDLRAGNRDLSGGDLRNHADVQLDDVRSHAADLRSDDAD